MANDENKIILEFPATNVEIEFGETITFDNISGFLDSGRVTYNGESLTEKIAHLENDKADNTKIALEYDEEKTYYRGNIVLYNGVLYECDVTDTSGEFYPSDWKEITLGEGIEEVKNLLDSDYYTKIQSDYRFLGKTNPSGTGYFSLNRRGSAGAYSVSVGRLNEANAQSSFAEGESNTSSGYASHSEGYGNAASGLMAHAEGVTTESSGYGSHSEGVGTIAKHIGQHVFGAYNVADPSTAQPTAKGNYIEIVGNGTDDDRRRNARTLDWSGNETLMGDLTFNGNKSLTSEISRLDGRIDNLPSPMIFKGTLGVGGTIQSLPTASASNEGYTYKVITDGTYAGQTAKVGDVFTSNGSSWVLIPSGDEDNDTWRAIKVEGIEVLGNGISSGAVDFVGSENIEVEFDTNGNKVGIKTKNIYTKNEVDDIVYNILPDDTASGSVANFETDLALPLKSLEIDVNAKQDLHGEANPYPAGGGINKWNEEWELGGYSSVNGSAINYTDRIRCKNAIPVLPSTSYCIRFGTTASSVVNAYDENGDFIENLTTGTFGTGGRVITTPANCYFIKFSVGTAYGTTYNNDISVNYPSTDTDYHPYENICPIEGWSEVKLAKIGNNTALAPFLRGLLQGKYAFVEMSSLAWTYSSYLDVNCFVTNTSLPNVKAPATSGQTANAISNGYTNVSSNGVTSPVFVSGTMFIWTTGRLFVRNTNYTDATSFKDSLQGTYLIYELDEPVTPTITVEQFNTLCQAFGTSGVYVTIALGGTYYGGHFTQDKAGHRQFEVTHALTTVSEMDNRSWYYSTSNGFWINEGLANTIVKTASGSEVTTAISDYFETVSRNNLKNADDRLCVNTSGYVCIYGSELPTTKNEFLSSVGNAKLVYPLATPYTIDLPDGEPIITLNGTNNIYADTGDTSVVFKDSVSGYVEKKIANVQALALNT